MPCRAHPGRAPPFHSMPCPATPRPSGPCRAAPVPASPVPAEPFRASPSRATTCPATKKPPRLVVVRAKGKPPWSLRSHATRRDGVVFMRTFRCDSDILAKSRAVVRRPGGSALIGAQTVRKRRARHKHGLPPHGSMSATPGPAGARMQHTARMGAATWCLSIPSGDLPRHEPGSLRLGFWPALLPDRFAMRVA